MKTAALDTINVAPWAEQPTKPLDAMGLLTSRFDHYYTLIFKYLLNRLFDRELAEELAANTFYKAAVNRKRIPNDAKAIEYWLIRIATNLANTHYRKRKWYRLLLEHFAKVKPDIPEVKEDNEDPRKERMRAIIKELPSKDQMVVVLRYYNRMSSDEVASILHCRPDAVRARLSRAMNKIRKKFGSSVSLGR